MQTELSRLLTGYTRVAYRGHIRTLGVVIGTAFITVLAS
jgi:hypothetical protein